MPVVDFGSKLSGGKRDFVRLKEAGSSLHFRLLGPAVAEGNHFFQTDGEWDIQPCPRINKGEECEHCRALFNLLDAIPGEIKKDKEAYSKEKNSIKNSNRPLVVAITYNFPVIDRETHQFAVFQATPGTRTRIEAEFALGTKMLDVDFKAKNTGLNGKDRYALTRVDSAETEPLTPAESDIKEKFNLNDFVARIEGTMDEDSGVAFEANSETEDNDSVPF